MKQIAKSRKETFRVPSGKSAGWFDRPPTDEERLITAGGSAHWDSDRWEAWLKTESPAAWRRFSTLLDRGCSRSYLASLLIALQSSRMWAPLSKQTMLKAIRRLTDCREALDLLASSDVVFWLGLRHPEDYSEGRLEPLQRELRAIEALAHDLAEDASERNSRLRDGVLAVLVQYVRWATDTHQESALSELLPAVLGRPDFSFDAWVKRKRNRALIKAAQTHIPRWERQAAAGRLPHPRRAKNRR
jgi:hypothetical protein